MFSVVIPLYNKAHAIARSLFSVLNQTFSEFEVLIVNDGSTDNSVEVIRNLTTDNRVRIIDQKNQGVSAARNNGIAQAKSEYVALLDADDEWLPYFLEKMNLLIKQFPGAGIYGSSSFHRNIQTGEGVDFTPRRYKGKAQVVDYFENPHVMPHTSAVILSKRIFFKVDENGCGFPVGMKMNEDGACFYRMALIAPVVYLGFPLGIRNNNVGGQITDSSKEERYQLLSHEINFYHIVYQAWKKSSERNKNYLLFMKYEIRGKILIALRRGNLRSIVFIHDNLDAEILDKFPKIEFWLYRQTALITIAKVYIYLTKLIWRMHGFPRVSQLK